MDDLLEKVIKLCIKKYPKHNWVGHIIPVKNISLRLQKQYGGEKEIIEPAAYMHDLGRTIPYLNMLQKFGVGHEVSGYHYARFKLRQFSCDDKINERIARCVLTHAGSGQSIYAPENIEEEIIMNADSITVIEQHEYLFAIHYSTHGKDLAKSMEWFLRKLDRSYETKITLPGLKDEFKNLYKELRDGFNWIDSE